MYLKELTINGFKSFAKKSELEFSAPITAIVGPNGSGKSNVAESFRFVLGEQSVKSMRGKKGEDLIWGGSEKIARGNRASVQLVFDNTERLLELDFDEVILERVVHRDGQNEYKINGSAVRLKDIHELLAGANIGSTGHHIISQGEADRVLSANPKERREMIEDALGLKVYQLKKQETERKLSRTEENISQVESLRREAAPHLKYLKKQVDKAERALKLQAELSDYYAEYLKREDIYLAARADTLQAARQEPAATLETVIANIKEARNAADSLANTKDSTELEEAKHSLKEATQKWQTAEREVSQLTGQINFLKRRLERNQSSTTNNEMLPLVKVSEALQPAIDTAETALQNNDPVTIKTSLETLLSDLKKLTSGSEETTIDLVAEDIAELEELQKKVEQLKETVDQLQSDKESNEAAVARLQREQVDSLEGQRNAEKELFELLEQQRSLESKIQVIDSELSTIERDRSDFKQQLQEAVTLLGRGAAQYFSYTITDESGNQITDQAIAAEDRTIQRNRQRELEKMKIRLEELGVGETEGMLEEYKAASERDEFLARELDDLRSSVKNLHELIDDLETKLEEQFFAGVDKITTEFNRFFTLMFGGGSAALTRVKMKQKQTDEDEEDVTEEGVDLEVSLPNKRVKGLTMLSGGERALTSIALIFAMSQINPPPFIILDETDAALDEANSRRYGDMVEALAQRSQLVLITHNRETMSRASILYGITMGGDGVSKVLSVKFDEAVANAK